MVEGFFEGTGYFLLVDEDQLFQIATGFVSNSVKALARTMLDWAEEDQRKADLNAAYAARGRK